MLQTAAARPITGVLVSYEPLAHGRAALFHALDLARRAGVPLTVTGVATMKPVNAGCARCRQSAAIWNREMRAVAAENLAEAANLLGPSLAVDYVVATGRAAHAIGEAADRAGADAIVVPWQPGGRLRRPFSRNIAEDLRRVGRWEVIVAPAATRKSKSEACVTPAIAPTGMESQQP